MTTVNSAYLFWWKRDQMLAGWIIATLSEHVLAQVVRLNTSFELWRSLVLQYVARPSNHYSSKYPHPIALLTKCLPKEPTTYSQASKSSHWKHAMETEIDAILKQSTWTLVSPDPRQNVVGNRWVYKIT